MLKLSDLKEQGLTLSKMDAQEMHHLISHIAQRGGDENIVFAGTKGEDKKPAAAETGNDEGKVVQKVLKPADFRGEKGNALRDAGYKSGDLYPREEPGDSKPNDDGKEQPPIKHIVTQEDLDTNPNLATNGVKVGDEIELPATEETEQK